MNFQDLHELLRVELVRRIERGTLTGTRLARQAGFQQAHISNFLNRKRSLSLEGLDRVLASQNIAIDQLLPIDLQAAYSPQAHTADPTEPLITPGAIAVLDRHYNSLAPYRAHQPTLYAVRCGAALLLRFVDFDEGRLILRPYSRAFPVQLLPLATHETPADYIVGRVCLVFSEL